MNMKTLVVSALVDAVENGGYEFDDMEEEPLAELIKSYNDTLYEFSVRDLMPIIVEWQNEFYGVSKY